jgi:hypothetical protein
MKKLILVLMVIFLAITFLTVSSFAAWTITAKSDKDVPWKNDQRIYRVKVYCLSDGTNPAAFNLSDEFDGVGGSGTESLFNSIIPGSIFYQVETDPGVAPDAVWTVTINSDIGGEILALTGLSVTTTEIHDAAADLGFPPIIFDLIIDIGDIGSANDEVTLYIYVIK